VIRIFRAKDREIKPKQRGKRAKKEKNEKPLKNKGKRKKNDQAQSRKKPVKE